MSPINESSVRVKYQQLVNYLIANKISITTMESFTSGYIASLITDTPGASEVFRGALVTYCNEMKVAHGVPESIISEHGVYSRECAQAMALACKESFGADIAIGTTGTTGNVDPNNPEASIGQVYFAVAMGENVETQYYEMEDLPERHDYKVVAADLVVGRIFDLLHIK